MIIRRGDIKVKKNKLEFNTYCFFTGEKDISQTIGLIFKDYLENIKEKISDYLKYL